MQLSLSIALLIGAHVPAAPTQLWHVAQLGVPQQWPSTQAPTGQSAVTPQASPRRLRPVPVKVTLTLPPGGVALTLRVADLPPGVCGLKVTTKVQEAPAINGPVHGVGLAMI